MADKLKVLMLGGRRCGKTSALSTMFGSIINGVINQYLTLADETILETKINDEGKEEVQDALGSKSSELKHLLEKGDSATFIVDQNPTGCWWFYTLKLQEPGTNREMYIEFSDVPGEFCRKGNKHEQEVKDYIKTCDVFVVAIDTPYMMEAVNPSNKLCDEGINEQVNRTQDIQQFLTSINDDNGNNAKMVIFVPVKCEKWYNEGNINLVTDRVKEVYNTHIQNLKAYAKMDISILPIMTAGNIEFVEQRETFLLSKKIGKPIKCCQQSSTMLRLSDGKPYKIKEGDIVNEDPEAVITGTTLVRPSSWYKLRFIDGKALYAPKNCEQLPLHIIRFMLAKYNNAVRRRRTGITIIDIFIDLMDAIFGNFGADRLGIILNRMKSAGLFNDSEEDGIVHIKNAF